MHTPQPQTPTRPNGTPPAVPPSVRIPTPPRHQPFPQPIHIESMESIEEPDKHAVLQFFAKHRGEAFRPAPKTSLERRSDWLRFDYCEILRRAQRRQDSVHKLLARYNKAARADARKGRGDGYGPRDLWDGYFALSEAVEASVATIRDAGMQIHLPHAHAIQMKS